MTANRHPSRRHLLLAVAAGAAVAASAACRAGSTAGTQAQPASQQRSSPPARPSASAAAEMPELKRCDEKEAMFDGGSFLRTDDRVALWYKVAGNAKGSTVLYLHGGPCFGSYEFEKSAGRSLEKSLRMIYLDQRGCSRSTSGTSKANLSMESTVEDIERLRRHVGVDKLDLVAHSAGGWVALEYVRRHADRVGRLVLVDTSPAFQRSVQHRLDYAASIAPRAFPQHAEKVGALARRAREADPAGRMQCFGELAQLLGPALWFRSLYYATDREQADVTRLSSELQRRCHWYGANEFYARDGYFTRERPELLAPLPVPAMLLAGRQSQVFGARLLEEAARAWRADLRWIDGAGHFPFVAQPELFTEAVVTFLTAPAGPGMSAAAARGGELDGATATLM